MNCPNPKSLQALLDETLPAEEQPTIQTHLETCEFCQKVLERLAAGGITWDKAAANLTPKPAGNETALLQAVNELQSASTNAGQTQAGAATAAPMEDLSFLQPPQKPGALGRLDKYDILAVVGKGGFGIVLKGFDDSLHRVVAIKVMSPQIASNGPARQRFIREAQAAAAVTHENVVTIHEVNKDAPVPYLVMQFVSGVTLADKIEKTGALSLKEILRIAMQTAEGLAAAHKQGLVHRDIKPANILLENGVERVKITDFGLARSADDASITQSGVIAGTPMFMSPEQADGKPVDHRSDLFSLGSVLYVMCTGKPPFRAASTMAVLKRVCEETPRPIRASNPELPEWLDGVIAKLHAKKPEERFQSAKEVAELLGQHLAHVQQPAMAPMPTTIGLPRQQPPAMEPSSAMQGGAPSLGQMVGVYGWFRSLLGLGLLAIICAGAVFYVFFAFYTWSVFGSGMDLFVPTLVMVLSLTVVVSLALGNRSKWAPTDTAPRPLTQLGSPKRRVTYVIALPILAGLLVVAGVVGPRFWPLDPNMGQRQNEMRAFTPIFGGPDWKVLHDSAAWTSTGDFTAAGAQFQLWPDCQLDTKEKLSREFHVRMEVRLSYGEGTIRLRAQPRVLRPETPPPTDGWFLRFEANDGEFVDCTLDFKNGAKAKYRSAKIARQGDWFYLEVIAKDGNTDVLVDGEKVISVPHPNVASVAGILSLWNSGEIGRPGATDSAITFRNIEVKDLTPATPPATEPGWIPLFNGKDLSGWIKGSPSAWKVQDGLLIGQDKGIVLTQQSFRDFHCRLQAKASADFVGDFGLRRKEKAWATVRLGNRRGDEYRGTLRCFSLGAIDELIAGQGTDLAAPDRWFELEVIAKGRHVIVRINGVTTADADAELLSDSGQLGLECAAGEIQIRKMEIKDLTPAYKNDGERLQGYWVADWVTMDGVPIPAGMLGEIDLRFEQGRVHAAKPGAKPEPCAFHVDESGPIKKIDIIGADGRNSYGIYRFDDDRLILCLVEGTEANRPKSFSPTLGAMRLHMVFKRAPLPKEPAWTPLFNGKDLAGWGSHKSHTGNWHVAAGQLICSKAENAWFFSDRADFKNFHLRMEFKLERGQASAIVRASQGGDIEFPVYGVTPPGAVIALPVGIVTEKKGSADGPAPEWQSVEIVCRGKQLKVKRNGQPFEESALGASIPSAGHLVLQSLNALIRFRKIEIMELPSEELGWVPLFNGKDLAGWETADKGTGRWKVVDGAITCDGPCSYLFTKRDDFKDFHFRVEARLNAKGNSGQYFRCRFEPGWPKGYYAQINNSDSAAGTRTGALNRVALSGGFESLVNVPGGLVLDNAWFTQEVIAKGNHLQILVNGKKVADFIDKDNMFMQGRLALEHMTEPTRVEFRKIEIKELPPEPGWLPLFNGKDLTGWTPTEYKCWQAKDGLLTALVPGNLALDGLERIQPGSDHFHLRLEGKLGADSSMSVLFHRPAHAHWVELTNKSIGLGRSFGKKLAGVDKPFAAPDKWFQLDLIAEGPKIRVLMNGENQLEFTDPDWKGPDVGEPLSILCSRQAQNKAGVLSIKKIEIKELRPGYVPFAPGATIAGWGQVVDPTGKCHVALAADELAINVPPGNYLLTTKNMDAPRVLREVKGDFTAQVVVQPMYRPGANDDWVGSGLIVWKDADRYVRFVRASYEAEEHVLAVQVYDKGKAKAHKQINFADKEKLPVWLRVEKRDGRLHFLYSTDAKKWHDAPLAVDEPWPGELKVGVYGSNSTKTAHLARFRGLEIKELPTAESGWGPLFNGKDLTGWTTEKEANTRWKVANGAITCSGATDHLYTVRDDFGDFHLRAEAKINAKGNSGIYFRAGKPLKIIGDYEAQITTSPDQAEKTGSLFGLRAVGENIVPPDTWFSYEIIAKGNRIRLLVNGKETANYQENRPDARSKGHIAVQHLEDSTVVHFRKIEIKELPPAGN